MSLQKISKEELCNIDLDIYSLMRKMPNNELYNSLYIRWVVDDNDTFIRVLCNTDELTGLLGALITTTDKTITDQELAVIDASKYAILNLAIHILKDLSDSAVDEFLSVLKNAKLGTN